MRVLHNFMGKKVIKVTCLLLAVVAALGFEGPAYATTKDEAQDKIDKLKDDREELKDYIKSLESLKSDSEKYIRELDEKMEGYAEEMGNLLDSLKEQFREDAGKRVKTSLVLEKIAKVENIEVTEQDIEKEYETICEQNGMKMEDVRKYVHEHDVRDRLQLEKTVKFCVDNAVVT